MNLIVADYTLPSSAKKERYDQKFHSDSQHTLANNSADFYKIFLGSKKSFEAQKFPKVQRSFLGSENTILCGRKLCTSSSSTCPSNEISQSEMRFRDDHVISMSCFLDNIPTNSNCCRDIGKSLQTRTL